MREEIKEGKEDREGFLHAEKTIKGPFAVELNDRLGRFDALVGDYMLASIIAFRGASPEEESMEEWNLCSTSNSIVTVLSLADLNTLFKFRQSVTSTRICNSEEPKQCKAE